MDLAELRRLGTADIDFRGHLVSIVPSRAVSPFAPGLKDQPMTWELRVGASAERVLGYIDDERPGSIYAYDPVTLRHGLGRVCNTLNEALHAILDDEYPLPPARG